MATFNRQLEIMAKKMAGMWSNRKIISKWREKGALFCNAPRISHTKSSKNGS
jgi:hypothetical protein